MNYLRFSNETKSNNLRILDFVSFLKPDFVDKAVIIAVDDSGIINHVRLHSNTFGIVSWINGEGFVNCHRWENEDDARSVSNLSKHYTALLINGPADILLAKENILPDIISSINSKELLSVITEIEKNSSSSLNLNIEKLIAENN
ncbi:MAG TPA: hypothetical protein PK624_09110 [Spirochaetota bacterium]|nr:hypothetical protein [Spirochaetota bacterium]HOR44941.1 hypothetical protein [Spirochaetota bacterium]HPK56951.1 hypothetical protein [Spirochaetota bacterium]